MYQNIIGVMCLFMLIGCGKKDDSKTSKSSTNTTNTTAKVNIPTAKDSNNPVVAEFAPLWGGIAKCDSLADLGAQQKCPPFYTLIEAGKKAYAGKKEDPKRFHQVHEALVHQIITGKTAKSRSAAAYVDWAKVYRGGDKYKNDKAQALTIVAALKREPEGEKYKSAGYSIVNVIGRWWKANTEVRKEMAKVMMDKKVKTLSGRQELVRHAGWYIDDYPELLGMFKKLSTDKSEKKDIRGAATSALASAALKKPELVEILVQIATDNNEDTYVRSNAVSGLSNIKAETEQSKKASESLVELAKNAPKSVAKAASMGLGRKGDVDALSNLSSHYKSNKDEKNSAVIGYAVYYYGLNKKMHENPKVKGLIRKLATAVLKNNDADKWSKKYSMEGIASFGGKKSAKICKKLLKDKDTMLASAAKKCVEDSSKKKK